MNEQGLPPLPKRDHGQTRPLAGLAIVPGAVAMQEAVISSLELEPLPAVGAQPAYLAPLVRAIWPARAEEIVALFETGGADIDAASDHPFAIRIAGDYVGITGYYRYDEHAVGLCWHGVIPAMRGRGISRAAFEQVCALAKQRYPHAQQIVELIPSDREAHLVPYFEKLGFRCEGEIATFEYLPRGPVWRVYRAPLVVSHRQVARSLSRTE